MTTAKNEVFIELQHENCYLVEGGGVKLSWGDKYLLGKSTGETFPGGGGISKFWASGGGTHLIPPVKKTLLSPQKV